MLNKERLSYKYHEIKGYYSNSFLSLIKGMLNNDTMPEKNATFFEVGKEFEDCLLYGTPTESTLIKNMVKATYNNSLFKSLFTHPKLKIQHEYYGKFEVLPFKAKSDMLIPSVIVPDIKSTSEKTIEGFHRAMFKYDYDRQMYIYMNVFKCPMSVLIATSKEKNPQVFVVPIEKDGYIYNSGKQKTNNLISIIKSL